jgi:hypothetical protein
MRLAVMMLAALGGAGCGTVGGATRLSQASAECDQVTFGRQELQFRCGGVVYDLQAIAVQSERIFDIVDRVSFTRRHYLVQANGRSYAFKAEQLEGERYPRRVVVETRRGFTRLELDGQGNVVAASPAVDLSL